jgi:SAM-dependent methyltransferase
MSMDSSSSDPGENTYVFDAESAAEMARLIQLDQFTTRAMGGPLAGLPDLPAEAKVLDIACGPGRWVLDVAFAQPDAEVAGIDISQTMIRYAIARARSQGLNNASFEVMNVLKPLEFSDETFDLVNARLLVGVLSRTEWPRFIKECYRITRSGGTIRLTDTDWLGLTGSPAFEKLSMLMARAARIAGYGFSPDGRTLGITHKLGSFLRGVGCQNVQVRAYAIDFSGDTDAWGSLYRNYEILFKLGQPLLLKTGVATQEEVDQLYQQMLIEMHAQDFSGVWYFLSAWGTKP